MGHVVLREARTGTRHYAGTDWPVLCQLTRWSSPGKRASYTLVIGLCRGGADMRRTYNTKAAAERAFETLTVEGWLR